MNASVERSKRYPHIHTEFRVGVAEQLPYSDNFFDAVVSFHAIEHVQDVDRVVQEMFRVLKPGGRVYIETTNSLIPREEHYRVLWIPGMPKPLARCYVRMLGKDPRLLRQHPLHV